MTFTYKGKEVNISNLNLWRTAYDHAGRKKPEGEIPNWMRYNDEYEVNFV